MTTVRKLLESKEFTNNFTIESSLTMLDAVKVMAEAHIGAVLLTDNHKIVGTFTERDYLTKGELAGRVAKYTKLKDVMTPNMMTVSMDTSVEKCVALMKQYQIRHLPVVEHDQLVGLVSMRDVMAVVLENKQSEIRGLENYIMGSGFQY